MSDAVLLRLEHNEKDTLGVLLYRNAVLTLTLELPWLNNNTGISRIPEGNYICGRRPDNKWEVKDVPNRTAILFHKGNAYYDSHGCILLGLELSQSTEGFRTISHSSMALDLFEWTFKRVKSFTLEVIDWK